MKYENDERQNGEPKKGEEHVAVEMTDEELDRVAGGRGGGAGKVSFSDISFTTAVNKATPKLML